LLANPGIDCRKLEQNNPKTQYCECTTSPATCQLEISHDSMLASFLNLAVARPPQFIAPAHDPQCPNASKATGRFNRAGINRSA
jgi:hypothetical protein